MKVAHPYIEVIANRVLVRCSDSVSIFGGAKLPWTNSDAAKISSQVRPNEVAVSAKKLSPEEMERLKRNLVKPIVSKKADTAPAEAAPAKKKGLFGLF